MPTSRQPCRVRFFLTQRSKLMCRKRLSVIVGSMSHSSSRKRASNLTAASPWIRSASCWQSWSAVLPVAPAANR